MKHSRAATRYPQFLRQQFASCARHQEPVQCECGKPATHLGKMTVFSPHGWPLAGAMLLCPECASLVDAGVTVEPL